MQMTAIICVTGGEELNETPILISVAPGGGGLGGVLLLVEVLVVAIAVPLYVVMVVMVVVITLVVVMLAGLVLRLIPGGTARLRREEPLGRAGQDVPAVLWRRRPRVPHGARPVRRPRRTAALSRNLTSLDGTALELGLLLRGAGLRRVGDPAAGDDRGRGLRLGNGTRDWRLGMGLRAVSEVALHQSQKVRIVVRRLCHADAAGEVTFVVVWHRGETRAALAEHGLREVGARLEGVLPYRLLEKNGKLGTDLLPRGKRVGLGSEDVFFRYSVPQSCAGYFLHILSSSSCLPTRIVKRSRSWIEKISIFLLILIFCLI